MDLLSNGLTDGWKTDGWLFDFDSFLRPLGPGAIEPPVDIVEDDNSYHFTFEMPGVAADSLNLRVEEGVLTVEAERNRPEHPANTSVHRRELSYGAVRRDFRLPGEVNDQQITAAYHDGMLEVTISKPEKAKPVKIPVTFKS